MEILVDVLILALLALFTYFGWKKGFVLSFFGFFGGLISFIISSILSGPIGSFVSEKILEPFLFRHLSTALSDQTGVQFSSLSEGNIPESVVDFFNRFGVDLDGAFGADGVDAGALVENSLQQLSSQISETIGFSLTFLILFIIVSIALGFAVKAFHLITKLPFLNGANKLLGLACGFGLGLLLSALLAAFFYIAAPFFQSSDNQFLNSFDPENTKLVSFLFSLISSLVFFH